MNRLRHAVFIEEGPCAAKWNIDVKEPENGADAPQSGASDTGRKTGKPSRRGKRRRNGSPHAVKSPVSASQPSLEPAVGRSDEPAEGGAPRKRKRRRSRTGEKSQSQQNASQTRAAEVEASRAASAKPAAESGDAAGKSRRNRRKARNRRSIQGRPLPPVQSPAVIEGRREQSHDRGQDRADSRGAEQGHTHPHSHHNHGKGHEPGRGGAADGERQHHHSGGEVFPRQRPREEDLYAALDLGTNNCRLLVAQPARPGQFRVVDAFSRIVRLGEGLAASGRLSEEAMDRAVEALKVCAAKIRNRDIRRMRLIATEACRQAENGEAFLQRVTAETGLELEIINRETEARLAVSGCSSLVGREARSVVLFDIGGGSSEIAFLDIKDQRASRLHHHITHWTSLPVGVVTLSERHGGQDVTPDVFAAMVAEVEGMLGCFDCPPVPDGTEGFYLIGTSGTVTTLAGVHLNLPRYDRRQVDGLWLSDPDVSAMQAKLLSWNFAERAANACIGPDRADLVLAGCAILEAIRRRWPSERMRVADRGLREGLLTDMMADDGVWSRSRMRRNNRNR